MRKKRRPTLEARHLFYVLAGVCLALVILTSVNSTSNNILRIGVNTVLMPVQKGFNWVGSGIFGGTQDMVERGQLQTTNEELQEQIAELTEQNTRYRLQLQELEKCQELLNLKEQYPDYDTVGAHIIGKNSDNWYKTILVDKGSLDGIEENMNVIADGGLVGIVTSVTPTTATISTIINDNRNVGGMALNSHDSCIVSGDLTLYQDGLLRVGKIVKDSVIEDNEQIVTSNTSEIYLPGILIGYVKELEVDANNLTKSGYLVPVVNFSKLDTVLIIKVQKENAKLDD